MWNFCSTVVCVCVIVDLTHEKRVPTVVGPLWGESSLWGLLLTDHQENKRTRAHKRRAALCGSRQRRIMGTSAMMIG